MVGSRDLKVMQMFCGLQGNGCQFHERHFVRWSLYEALVTELGIWGQRRQKRELMSSLISRIAVRITDSIFKFLNSSHVVKKNFENLNSMRKSTRLGGNIATCLTKVCR